MHAASLLCIAVVRVFTLASILLDISILALSTCHALQKKRYKEGSADLKCLADFCVKKKGNKKSPADIKKRHNFKSYASYDVVKIPPAVL